MDAQQRFVRPRLGRALGIAFGLVTQVCFVVTVWGLFWYLYGSDSAVSGRPTHWFLVDSLLALQFAVVHSWLLLPSSRSWIGQWLSPALYGTLFCAATCAGLWLVFLLWQTAPSSVWNLHGAAAAVTRAAFAASWLGLFYSLSLSGFGYQTGWTQWRYWLRGEPLPRRGVVQRGSFRWLRHPAYLSFLGLVWFTPHMTIDHALLTGTWTLYIFVGSVLKDRRLEFYLGDDYREYAARVPGYPGMPFGPLARWPKPKSDAQSPVAARAA
jgi:hypothetical protein